MLGVFALTLFWSATLLFLVEPMVGKMMLPLLGGTPAVWNTCMVFFQAILLAGYAYAHATTSWLGPRKQAVLHILVLVLPLVFFAVNGPIAINRELIARHAANPMLALLLVLSLTVGVPMFVVCASAPLLQRWFASTDHPDARDPYFLYGASNLGSMLALIAYPAIVEPNLTLASQRIGWAIAYGGLVLLTAACAWLMWKAPTGGRPTTADGAATEESPRAREPVTWLRRLRWVTLALVPSSLMLGVTTYITTDVAAIPLLWVVPLALYLLTFIVVFARIAPRTQRILTAAGIVVPTAALMYWAPEVFGTSAAAVVRVIGVAIVLCGLLVLRLDDPAPMHRAMILAMPLVVLLGVGVVLADFRLGLLPGILLHLVSLFVVAMVCHGELARDRPAIRHLTEYFLWMSFGGVVGGLFNALVAPLAFNSIVEYQLMLVAACLLLPAEARGGATARWGDLVLLTACLLLGGYLLATRYREGMPDLAPFWRGPWRWGAAALVLGGLVAGLGVWRGWSRAHWLDHLLDVALPLALGFLLLALDWGLATEKFYPWAAQLADWAGLALDLVVVLLTFTLPVVLCFAFVDRPIRLGLGVGAVLLAAWTTAILHDRVVYQKRGFFGVLRVLLGNSTADGHVYPYAYLLHGTTIHGRQFLDADLRYLPHSYFHPTGPIGQVFRTYNTDPKRAVAIIGLGTGTLACYALPGQTVDYFEIDPDVVDLCFDSERFFTFVADAERRGAHVRLVLGDARLTFEPTRPRPCLEPLHRRPGAPAPPRRYGPDLLPEQKYGLIVIDAFSSDAIPVHLITVEAVKLYRDRLLPGGLLCFHITNRYIELEPVLANIAEELDLVGYHFDDADEYKVGKAATHWVVMARQQEHLAKMLAPPRWTTDDGQLALLGASLWPGQAGSAGAGLSYALLGFEAHAAEQAKVPGAAAAVDWQPLDTPTELRRRLDAATEVPFQARLRRQLATSRRIGVWSDDYSNLLGVFYWR
jgi:hypothetical protein